MEEYKFKKIDSTSVAQNVIDQLVAAIIQGNIKPGDKIPTEIELSKTFGVARNSIREAIKILVAFGVLEIRRPEGTFVCQGLSKSMISPLLYGIILNSGDSYKSLREFRKCIEEEILKLSIKNHTEEDLPELKEAYDSLVNLANSSDVQAEAIREADDYFHKIVAKTTYNILMVTINEVVRTLTFSRRCETTEYLVKNDREYLIDSHKIIFNAIINRDISNVDSIIPDKYIIDY